MGSSIRADDFHRKSFLRYLKRAPSIISILLLKLVSSVNRMNIHPTKVRRKSNFVTFVNTGGIEYRVHSHLAFPESESLLANRYILLIQTSQAYKTS